MLLLSAVPRPYDAELPLALLLVPLWMAVVVLHEMGHLAAAAIAGARVFGFSVGPLWFERRRRGVRVHWRRIQRGVAGMALAVPDFSKDVRRQMLVFVVGGPLANLLAAAFCLTIAGFLFRDRLFTATVAAMFVFGLLNGVIGLLNLLPTGRGLRSDGLLLRLWWKGGVEASLQMQVLRMYDRSLNGELACELPPHEIEALESSEMIGVRFLGSYLSLRAAQQRDDLPRFNEIMVRGRAELKSLDASTYESLRFFWAFFEIEEAFENARAGEPSSLGIGADAIANVPKYFRYRLDAAQARSVGDERRWRRAMARARRDVQGAFDASARRAETALLDRIGDFPLTARSDR